ncbi:MAG: transglutaminase-like domain-containing protein [Akkermansiaceae bacterium]
MLQPPPRLLLGVAMLFWGAMGDFPLVGLLAAVAIEARNWTFLRWQFGETGFARAWQLCIVILIIVAVTFLTSDEDSTASASLALLSWLPIIFLPMILAQQYASDHGVPLVSFSFIARRKIRLDREVGRAVKLKPCQLGFPFLGLTLISAGLGLRTLVNYGVIVAILFGIGLYFMRKERTRPFAWLTAYLLAGTIAISLAAGVFYLYKEFTLGRFHQSEQIESPREVRTVMGQIAELQLSEDIDWRYYQDKGSAPERLRLAVYNKPRATHWVTNRRSPQLAEQIDPVRGSGGDFEILLKSDGDFFYRKEHRLSDHPHRSRLVGLVKDESLLPLPRNPRRFRQLAAEGVDVSGMSSTRLDDPKHGALDISIISDSQESLRFVDLDPTIDDLVVPKAEMKGIEKFWRELGIADLPEWEAKTNMKPKWHVHQPDRADQNTLHLMLRAKFQRDFDYSLKLRPRRDLAPVSHFLHDLKEGHCEYFASATALLLRRAGIPTRYVVGYALEEKGNDPQEWIVRGKHAHAWTQAYLGGTWVDEAKPDAKEPVWRCRGGEWVEIDLTPPDWLSETQPSRSWTRKLADWWQKARPDLIVWFAGPIVSVVVSIILYGGLTGLVVFLIYRLWVTRNGDGAGVAGSWEERAIEGNPLADFEPCLAKRIGPRPVGMTMGDWLKSEAPELIPVYQKVRFNAQDAAELKPLAAEARARLEKGD